MRKLILSLILSGVLCIAGFAQSLDNVEQAVRYRANIDAATLSQPYSSSILVSVIDNRTNSQIEDLGSIFGWTRSNSQVEGLGSIFGWTRSNSQVEDLGSIFG
ncbi:MAG: hypothetical protein WAM24_19095, partial [Ignavibacteriaceae bacterium]